MNRKPFPKSVETEILRSSLRRCAFCFALHGDTREKAGQIAHIDRDPSNVSLENGAFLCLRHHDKYDSWSRQTKGYTIGELRTYLKRLKKYNASPHWPDAGQERTRGPGVSLEVFDRRVPTYRTTIAFIRNMLNGARHDIQQILRFAADTEEALFLFGDEIADYLAQLYKRALRLHAVSTLVGNLERRTPELVDEEMHTMLWFTEQFEETRKRFAPYLQLAKTSRPRTERKRPRR